MQTDTALPNILDHYGHTNSAFLHARGAVATRHLAALLNGQPGEKILEFGFGTGSTTAFMAACFPQTFFYGVDISPIMFQKAGSRLRFCGLEKRCALYLVEKGAPLPFEDGFFDKIYVESVLGMQEGEDLADSIAEIERLLKPGGRLVLNETIWLESTTANEIEHFNRQCLAVFNVIQANGRYPYVSDWVTLLENNGIQVQSIQSLERIDATGGISPYGLTIRLSTLFTWWGQLKARLHPHYRKVFATYKKDGEAFYGDKKYMEGMLMAGVKS